MQKELETDYPALDIELVGVNQVGMEAGNEAAAEGRDIPLLQDVDANGDGDSDVWTAWNVEWRDVAILDGNNAKVGNYNLTTYNLAEPENYASLREMLVDAAMQSQKPWCNPNDAFDIDNSTYVTPLDALIVINELNSAGSYELPPPPAASSPPPYYDCNGDGYLTPLDALQVINYLNGGSPAAVGEGEASSYPSGLFVDLAELSGTAASGMVASASSNDVLPESRPFSTHPSPMHNRDSSETQADDLAHIDEVFAALEDRPTDASLTPRTWSSLTLADELDWWFTA